MVVVVCSVDVAVGVVVVVAVIVVDVTVAVVCSCSCCSIAGSVTVVVAIVVTLVVAVAVPVFAPLFRLKSTTASIYLSLNLSSSPTTRTIFSRISTHVTQTIHDLDQSFPKFLPLDHFGAELVPKSFKAPPGREVHKFELVNLDNRVSGDQNCQDTRFPGV